jgi:hypothetical protein
VLAADVSNWLRPGAVTSPERLFCHVYGRAKGQAQMIPGWPSARPLPGLDPAPQVIGDAAGGSSLKRSRQDSLRSRWVQAPRGPSSVNPRHVSGSGRGGFLHSKASRANSSGVTLIFGG